jgi:hypothetical protein
VRVKGALAGLILGLSLGVAAQAEPNASSTPGMTPTAPSSAETTPTAEAREYFVQGVDLVKGAEWSNALSAFERSAQVRPHATTTFNIGACERAMGAYTRAKDAFERSLREGTEHPEELPPSLREEATGFVAEIDHLLARLQVTLDPPSATIAVDGRPMAAVQSTSAVPTYAAEIDPPGPGQPPAARAFLLLVSPGAHVFTLSRKGFADAVVKRDFPPGASVALDLKLDLLPATLDVSSNILGAIVSVDDKDFGPAPVSVLRPAGSYHVVVQKDGFQSYETRVRVEPGEESALAAVLSPEHIPITKKWWFWTSAAGVIAGGVVATYLLTRPGPATPPYDGGSTGWVVQTQSR